MRHFRLEYILLYLHRISVFTQNLGQTLYFSSVKDVFKEYWNDPRSKILSVISINGFIIALNRQLAKNGLGDYQFYNSHFNKLEIDFSKENFPYTASQYRKFSTRILREAFGFTDADLSDS